MDDYYRQEEGRCCREKGDDIVTCGITPETPYNTQVDSRYRPVITLNAGKEEKKRDYQSDGDRQAPGADNAKGMEERCELRSPIERNVYEMTDAEREELGIGTLPGSLDEAIVLAEGSDLVRETLGEHIFSKLIENKKIEWERYRMQITQYELDEYLPVL